MSTIGTARTSEGPSSSVVRGEGQAACAATSAAHDAECTAQVTSGDAYAGSTEESPMADLRKMRASVPSDVYGGNPAGGSVIDRCSDSACMCIPCA